MCIGFGAAYLSKVPVKKALAEYGLVEMTTAEKFWYVVENIAFAGGYFSKVIIKKALAEVRAAQPQQLPPYAQQASQMQPGQVQASQMQADQMQPDQMQPGQAQQWPGQLMP
jgi:hypothetical protein